MFPQYVYPEMAEAGMRTKKEAKKKNKSSDNTGWIAG